MTKILTVWDPRYCCEAAPLTSTTKQAKVVALGDHILQLAPANPDPIDGRVWDDIARTHDPRYVEAVRTGMPRQLAESQGFVWSPAFADSVARIWRGHQEAVKLALSTSGIVLHPVSGAHHAQYGRGCGFCTFNYFATKRPQRTLVIDLDAHYGDGTDAMTVGQPNAYHFDISGGYGRSTSGKSTRGWWFGVPNSRLYFTWLSTLEKYLDEVQPDLVFWQAGMDPFTLDDIGGVEGMDAEALAERDQIVARLLVARKLPTVVTLAGGYSSGVEYLHLQTLVEIQQALEEVGVPC